MIGLITALVVFIAFNKFSFLGIIYAIPGLVILLVYFYAASGTMAYLGLRYRDFQHALTGLFSLLFIVTPVWLWHKHDDSYNSKEFLLAKVSIVILPLVGFG